MISALPGPLKGEALRMRLIAEGHCVCCVAFANVFCFPEVHHLTMGGRHGAPRLGHAFTVGLCGWHHRGVGNASLVLTLGPSYARQPAPFRARWSDTQLLVLQAAELARVVSTYLIHPGPYACPLEVPYA